MSKDRHKNMYKKISIKNVWSKKDHKTEITDCILSLEVLSYNISFCDLHTV